MIYYIAARIKSDSIDFEIYSVDCDVFHSMKNQLIVICTIGRCDCNKTTECHSFDDHYFG